MVVQPGSGGDEDRRRRPRWLIHQFFHFADSLKEPDHHGSSDDAVADVEFDDLRQPGEPFYVLVGQAVAGIDPESEFVGQLGRLGDGFEFSSSSLDRLALAYRPV